ncbi:hypothetical protein HY214_02335 [Candidatus Roizmanbacteria bacterium]|nr:hypothetical protein [Candidatus Roizmanbacteria bacterium]
MGPQSQSLYLALLASGKPLSAKQLATKLHIFPNTVYRLAEPLTQIGLITKTNRYPCQFNAKPIDEGLSLFLLYQNDWFSQQFSRSIAKTGLSNNSEVPQSKQIKLLFIQSRDELMNLSVGEIDIANKTVDLLRSGHEIPADVMLSLIKAKRRGVVTRMLIQDFSLENADQVTYWQQNGILVRKTALRHIRLMLYDSRIVYFMSYKHAHSEKDLGMKISYPPFATILSQLFDQWWQIADKI